MARIAWVEDDYRMTGSLMRLLKEDGHIIVPFGSWEEVQKKVETICTCDIIILDIILPPIEDDPYLGLSVLDLLRNEHGYKGPVVICSRVGNPVVLRELRELGITEILRKPVRPSVLYDVVTKALTEGTPETSQ